MTPLIGRIEELPVPKLLERIAREHRSGVLRLANGARRALLTFKDGVAIAARAPGVPRLGDLLIGRGLCDPISVRGAARIQAEEQGQRLLGEILVANGVLTSQRLAEVVQLQLELTIAELRRWTTGRFQLENEEPRPRDLSEHATSPALGPSSSSRFRTTAATAPESASTTRTKKTDGQRRPAASTAAASAAVLEVITTDDTWFSRLAGTLPADLVNLQRTDLPAALAGPGEARSLVLVDLRDEVRDPAEIGRLRVRRPSACVLAIAEDPTTVIAALEAGALCAFPADPRAALATVVNLQEVLQPAEMPSPGPAAAAAKAPPATSPRASRRQRQREPSTSVALDLLRTVSQAVERAILFLVTEDGLQVLGAFGMSKGRSLASLTQGLGFALHDSNALSAAARDLMSCSLPFAGSSLPPNLVKLLDPPRADQAIALPISGGHTAVALIYADNGDLAAPLPDAAQLAQSLQHFGPVLETELLINEAARTLV